MTRDYILADIYWANSLFSEADRRFNEDYAFLLRKEGFTVFLPQEDNVNRRVGKDSPTAADIFVADTKAILFSRLLVACIDQETIDSGVASEIGIAYAYGIPIIGLYTDIRQHREGEGRMYKNPYVLGMIENKGRIVSSDQLLPTVSSFLSSNKQGAHPETHLRPLELHFDQIATTFDQYVSKLESWYQPIWNVGSVVAEYVELLDAKHVLDFGCATGFLGGYLHEHFPDITYVGYDLSKGMTRLAVLAHSNKKKVDFTSSWDDVVGHADRKPFDFAIISFALHETQRKRETISKIAQQVQIGGRLLIIDLSSHDLPRLTGLLRRSLAAAALEYDGRIDPVSLSQVARSCGLQIIEYRLALPEVSFPDFESIDEYLRMFGVYDGMDLPLGISRRLPESIKVSLANDLHQQVYPFLDQRVFTMCLLARKE